MKNQMINKDSNIICWGYKDKKYIGEKWECRVLETGEIKEFIFKHEMESNDTAEHTLTERLEENLIIDNSPTLLMDSYEEVLKNQRNRNPYNPRLAGFILKSKIRINILKEMLSNNKSTKRTGIFLMIRHKESPTLTTFKSLINWKLENPKTYQEIMEEVSMSMTLNH